MLPRHKTFGAGSRPPACTKNRAWQQVKDRASGRSSAMPVCTPFSLAGTVPGGTGVSQVGLPVGLPDGGVAEDHPAILELAPTP